jgi:hypothetical protein
MKPILDPESAPWWAACNEGRLTVPRCRACGERFFPPRRRCVRCWSSDVSLEDASGDATVLSYTVVRRSEERAVPYVVAVVELDEGVAMTTNIVGGDVEIGTRVHVGFERLDDEIAAPVFSVVS